MYLDWAYQRFPPRRAKSMLLVVMLPIGDTLFATPTIRALRRRFPGTHIAALAFPTNAGVLGANGDIDEIILHPTGQTFTLLGYARFLWELRQRHFTLTVVLRPYMWWLNVLCGIWRRLSFDMPVYYQWFLPIGPRPWKRRHAVDGYATVLHPLGVHIDTSGLVVRATAEDDAATTAFLEAEGVQPGDRLIALHPGGEGFRGMKRWDRMRFAVLGDHLAARYGARVVIVGGRDELALASEVAQLMEGEALVANGRISLGQTVALLQRCHLFVGNDSAPLHMAGSLGIPTVGIFGPTSLENYRPLGRYVEVARAGLICSPCFYFIGSHPVWADSRCRVPTCLHAVSVETVLEAAEKAIARKVAGG